MKVYIVTEGEYSDYHIEAVFLDERKAYAYCERLNKTDIENYGFESRTVEEYETESEELELTRMCAMAVFHNDECVQFCIKCATFKPLTFEKHFIIDRVFAEGDIKLRKDETIDQFRERAKKVVIDRYFDWKLRRANDGASE